MSFKKGVSDGLLEQKAYEAQIPNGHNASYRRGVDAGTQLKTQIAALVKRPATKTRPR